MAVSGNIFGIFRDYLKGKKCTPIQDSFDLYLDDENQFVPDFMVVCDTDKIKPDGVYGAPDLVVEVLSPSTAKNDKGYKTRSTGSRNTGPSTRRTNPWMSTSWKVPRMSSMMCTQSTLILRAGMGSSCDSVQVQSVQ